MIKLSRLLDVDRLSSVTFEASPSEIKPRSFRRAEVPELFQSLAEVTGELIENGPSLPPGGYRLFIFNENGNELIVAAKYQGRYFEVSPETFQSLFSMLK